MTTGLAAVHRFLVQHYNLEELHALCFDLGVKYDDLAGATLSGKARELVLWAGRQRKLAELLAALHHDRPTLFEPAGLRLEPPEVVRLYGSLDAFESSTASHSWWTRFRRRPGIFYPTLALAAVLVLVFLVSGLVGIAGGAAGAQRQLAAWGVLPTPTPIPSPTPAPTPTPTAIPLAFTPESAGEVLVVIATFQRLQGVIDVGAQEEIRRAIQQSAEEAGFANLRTEVEPAQLAADDRAGAQALGERYHASMVIWGEITGVRVTVNYLNLKQPDFDAARVRIEEIERTQLANPSAYSSFITQDLPGQMTFLSLFAVGQSLYSQAQYAESIRAIARAIASIQGGTIEGLAEAHFRLGWLYQFIPEPDHARAIASYTAAIGLAPNDASSRNNRGIARENSGDLKGALEDYTAAIELAPKQADAYNNRGNVRQTQGDLKGAIEDYTAAIKHAPDQAGAYYNRGNARYLDGDLKGAIADYTDDIKRQPEYAPAHHNRGLTYMKQGNLKEAIADFDAAIRLQPDYVTAYDNRGRAKAQQEDWEGAIADYDQALAVDAGYTVAYFHRGIARVQNMDWAGAIVDFDKVIDLTPEQADAYNFRGYAKAQQGDWAGAIADYDQALARNPALAADLKPGRIVAHANRGLARLQSGDWAGAIADYDTVIELAPDLADIYAQRGMARYANGNLEGAFADFDAALMLDSDNADTYYYRGLVRINGSGDLAGAIADYTRAVEFASDNAVYLDALCRAHALLQQGEQALPACERAVALDPQPGYRANRGLAYALVGRYDAAITDLQAYVDWLARQPGAEARLARPQAWLTALRAGRNPFTPEELAGIAADN